MMRKVVCVVFLSVLSFGSAYGQTDKYKALFFAKFTEMMRWPGEKESGDIRIAVAGNDKMLKTLTDIAGKTKVRNRSLVVIEYDPTQIEAYHVIYMSDKDKDRIQEISAQAQAANVVVISDFDRATKDQCNIQFVKLGDKLKYTLNPDRFTQAGFILSPVLERNAVRM